MKPTRSLGWLCALGAVMLGVRDGQAQGWPYGYLPEPLIVPVAGVITPYSPDAIWRAIAAGNTVPLSDRWRFSGGACVNEGFFLSRELKPHLSCFPARLTPWLQIEPSVFRDSVALLRAVMGHSLNRYPLRAFADTGRVLHAILVASPLLRGRQRTIRFDTLLVAGADTIRLRSLVLIPLPADSSRLSERLLINALPQVLGLPGELLARDPSGDPHIRTDAIVRLGLLRRQRLLRDTILQLDAMVRECGHLACIALNPAFAWQAAGDPGNVVWFLRVFPNTGLIVEALDTTANLAPGWMSGFRTRRVLPLGQPARIGTMLDVSWNSGVATVRLRRIAAPPTGLWMACGSLPVLGPGAGEYLGGKWQLEFVADTGRATGKSLKAELILMPTTLDQRIGRGLTGQPVIDSTYAFWGTLSTDLRRLGGIPAGNLKSREPMLPGVRVYARRERPGAPTFLDLSILLRPPPPHDRWETALDGVWNGLNVLAMDPETMAGTWESSGGEIAVAARGRFCGRRVE